MQGRGGGWSAKGKRRSTRGIGEGAVRIANNKCARLLSPEGAVILDSRLTLLLFDRAPSLYGPIASPPSALDEETKA